MTTTTTSTTTTTATTTTTTTTVTTSTATPTTTRTTTTSTSTTTSPTTSTIAATAIRRPSYVSPYLYLIYSTTTESSEEVNMIESLPIRSEQEIAQKPIYSLTTEFHSEPRMSEESR